jgi:predicted MFS family arabinose efflux permease
MSSLIGVAAGLGIPSTLLLGKMADGFAPHLLLWCCMAGNVLAFLILWTLPSFSLLVTALFIFGFAGGGFLPVYATFIGRLFGPASFGRVMGLGGIVMLPFGALSPVLIGAMRDGSGSYEGALLLPVSATAVGASFLAWITVPRSISLEIGEAVET